MELQNALRDKVISSICAMDVRMLDVLLPENGVYEGTYKEVWLGKLVSFFEKCRMLGDTSLTVSHKQCASGQWCHCGQKMWLFESHLAGKGFAIYFEMDGDEIKGIERCYGHYIDDMDVVYDNDTFDFEAFYVYEHEKIGFIDSYEFQELRKDVQQFMADMMNPKRHTLGVIGVKRKVRQYNLLYFDVKEVHYLFEYRIEMFQIYEDFFTLKNIFTQQKSFQLVINKCHELMQCSDTKSKVRMLKWFLRNEPKVKNYLVCHFEVQVEKIRMVYLYQVDGVHRQLVIRHPNIKMDVKASSFLQSYVKLFYYYLHNVHIKTKAYDPYVDSERELYNYFKDKMEEVIAPFELWVRDVMERSGT